MSEDPIGFNGGTTNLYLYAMNEPNRYTDPYGESPMFLLGPIIAFEFGYGLGVFGNTLYQTGSVSEAFKKVGQQSPLVNLYETGNNALFPEPIAGPIQVFSNPNTLSAILQQRQRTKKIDDQIGTCE